MAVALILLTLSLLVLTFEAVHRACVRIGERLVLAGCRRPCLGRPTADYVTDLTARRPDTRITVLIPEAEPAHLWPRLLQNQLGVIVGTRSAATPTR
ncbi:hypothetical protein Sgleb_07600 [Streptomyces glebosus]|uniref:Uncharacterized protein n=2 Tax=Streptomyces glebosus TaxID=249580 RepID=A0A640SMJ0_9ACTN|nr:hypothetical protein Sgleb_07600 [Streptomyces glebosus]GHG75008.1 hypothetical protein GCM10010513_49240 [Streptomyces glebosus]